MKKKVYAVFGLGKFGRAVAETLAEGDQEVLVVDADQEKVEDIADMVTQAIRADVSDPDVLRSLGIGNFDTVIVAISKNMEASIMATITAKEMGVPLVIAKATTQVHATVLQKIGADQIVFPEQEQGARMAKNLISGGFVDLFELSDTFSMVEMNVPTPWIGRNIKELNLRNKYGINIIAVKRGTNVDVNISPEQDLEEDETLVIIGETGLLSKLQEY